MSRTTAASRWGVRQAPELPVSAGLVGGRGTLGRRAHARRHKKLPAAQQCGVCRPLRRHGERGADGCAAALDITQKRGTCGRCGGASG
jgi:hypothetical protein